MFPARAQPSVGGQENQLMNNKVTYRQQFTRCGKQRCRKCKEGTGHGPYWYAYWSENGRTISKYIGIHPPADLEISANEETTSAPVKDIPPVQKSPGPLSADAADSSPTLRIYLLGQFRIERRSGGEW